RGVALQAGAVRRYLATHGLNELRPEDLPRVPKMYTGFADIKAEDALDLDYAALVAYARAKNTRTIGADVETAMLARKPPALPAIKATHDGDAITFAEGDNTLARLVREGTKWTLLPGGAFAGGSFEAEGEVCRLSAHRDGFGVLHL